MKKIFRPLFAAALALPVALQAFAWGQKGHDVTAAIAERHLTPATAAAVESILDGRSIIYWANWMDNASHTPEYAYTKSWHYRNVDADRTYDTMTPNPDGDIVSGTRSAIAVLTDPEKSKEDKALALKMVIHFLGDMHQPMHLGHATDLGGNRVKVKYFGRDANLHGIWDTNLVESAHKWSYTEWADQLDRVPDDLALPALSGNFDDWCRKNIETTALIYRTTPEGSSLSYNEVAVWAPVIEDSLLRGGLRLAHLLNSIFDAGYTNARTPSTF